MEMKFQFMKTTCGTVRATMCFDDKQFSKAFETKEWQLFQILSVHGGYDMKKPGMGSWELPLSLVPYLKEKFGNYKDCEMLI